MEGDNSLAPIALLIDSLRSQDAAQRLSSVKRLKTISIALGGWQCMGGDARAAVQCDRRQGNMWLPRSSAACVTGPRPTALASDCPAAGEERTRRELIPFVNESVDDEDEILLALAEELGDFVPLVGGAQHAHFLLPPLESLATVDETVVRERAVASICSVTSQMPPASVQEHLLPLLQVRGGGSGSCRSCGAARWCWVVCSRRQGAWFHGVDLALSNLLLHLGNYAHLRPDLLLLPTSAGAEAGRQRVAGTRVSLQAVLHSIPTCSGAGLVAYGAQVVWPCAGADQWYCKAAVPRLSRLPNLAHPFCCAGAQPRRAASSVPQAVP